MMLKYIIKDLKETLAYLPYGIMAGDVVGLLLNGLNGSGTVLYLGDECEEPCVCRGKCTAVYSLWIYLSLGIPMASGIFS